MFGPPLVVLENGFPIMPTHIFVELREVIDLPEPESIPRLSGRDVAGILYYEAFAEEFEGFNPPIKPFPSLSEASSSSATRASEKMARILGDVYIQNSEFGVLDVSEKQIQSQFSIERSFIRSRKVNVFFEGDKISIRLGGVVFSGVHEKS
ncbi:MAG: hypothetical protein O2910_04470 [Proteobacteria bacterium]|jgi:hypothetical protein|nr:hypothetical protein [Pseudomonadota bacterium]